ncbi:leucyl/phenylalanyl-tRNA--protein transferase [Conchiformibius kuhniae]|uniref:Leucyl/phenylalanyl-tRNA--protein transferase n=1 Tax=Conchiformibius kuhniae TaxID=211502 RepID=A0A8T9MT07_9NEIS|nr:leucyl/phenylalanyl-tRNA--protein transferase [Conchiformibius kuhniae]UOP04389.1 leucyl/phenylalanyl-tRNA--protein transferase [Conchiformibius kuhniae]
MHLPLLSRHDDFPDPRPALARAEHAPVCATDRLDAQRILAAYRRGIFPWYSDRDYFYWFATAPRAVLRPEGLHIPRSLAKTLRNTAYRITVNRDFAAVIAACAAVPRPEQDGTWIAPAFQTAYTALHRIGHAHSFECWRRDRTGREILAGGLYGVQIGAVFYGESMFARLPDASKTAFACAVPYLAQCGIRLIDCQQHTAHLHRFGAHTLTFDNFQAALDAYTVLPCRIGRGVIRDNPARTDAIAPLPAPSRPHTPCPDTVSTLE